MNPRKLQVNRALNPPVLKNVPFVGPDSVTVSSTCLDQPGIQARGRKLLRDSGRAGQWVRAGEDGARRKRAEAGPSPSKPYLSQPHLLPIVSNLPLREIIWSK